MKATRFTTNGIEWPTIAVAVVIYGGFALLCWYFARLPLWVAAPCGAVLLAWHGSLQHETIHHHPTRSRTINSVMGGIPLSLLIPYERYREIHLRHHRFGGRFLTDPVRDPESFYLPPGQFGTLSPLRRLLMQANSTLAGRLTIGPLLSIQAFIFSEVAQLIRGNPRHLRIWIGHCAAAGLIIAWIVLVCDINFMVYLFLLVYPAMSLTQLRSFAEHRANADIQLRTAVIESGVFWSTIFLYNNLHIVHHARPRLPWFELAALWRRARGTAVNLNSERAGLVLSGGYWQLARQYWLTPYIDVQHFDGAQDK